jgi:dGTPase
VYNLVTDIIHNSSGKPYIALSNRVSQALKQLKEFNMDRIYMNPLIKQHSETIYRLFTHLFETYMNDLEKENRNSKIFTGFLADMSDEYIKQHRAAEIVRDFIAGMTDRYFLLQCPEQMRPTIVQA